MIDLNNIIIFNQIVDSESFTQAALNLNMTKSTISRKTSELEETLGVKLITRSTRKLGLTQEGKIFYQSNARILEIMQQTELELTANQNLIRGHLNISMPVDIGHYMMSGYITSFLKHYPEITMDIEMTNRNVDMIGDGIDLSIHIGEMDDSSLIARTISYAKRIIVANPEYLSSHQPIYSPEDLRAPLHQIKTTNAMTSSIIQLNQSNQMINVNLPYHLKVNTITACKIACLNGLGIASLPEFTCEEYLKTGELIHILPDWELSQFPISLVFPQNKQQPKRLRTFIDHIIDTFESTNK